MTGEETKRLKEKFDLVVDDGNLLVYERDADGHYIDFDKIWNWILSEIITPYEKQLEQVEREKEEELRKIIDFNENRAQAWEKDITYKGKTYGDRSFRDGALSGHRWSNDFIQSLKSQNTQTK